MSSIFVQQVVLAEFHVKEGSTIIAAHPEMPPGVAEHHLATLMLPEGLHHHHRDMDCSFFRVKRASETSDSAGKDSTDAPGDRLFAIAVAKTVRGEEHQRGAHVRALGVTSDFPAIGSLRPALQFAINDCFSRDPAVAARAVQNWFTRLNAVDWDCVMRPPDALTRYCMRSRTSLTGISLGAVQSHDPPTDGRFAVSVEGLPAQALVDVTICDESPALFGASLTELVSHFGEYVPLIRDAVLAERSIMFISGATSSAATLAGLVCGAAQLAAPLSSFAMHRVFPYVSMTDMDFLQVKGCVGKRV